MYKNIIRLRHIHKNSCDHLAFVILILPVHIFVSSVSSELNPCPVGPENIRCSGARGYSVYRGDSRVTALASPPKSTTKQPTFIIIFTSL